MSAAKTKSGKSAARQPFYVISGKDRRRAVDTLHHLTEQLLGEDDPQLALTTYDGDVSLSQVLTDLNTLPFLSEFRIVVVKDADDFIKDHRQKLEDYQQKPSPSGVLILLPESFPKTTKLAKAIDKAGGLIDCTPVGIKNLPSYLTGYAKDNYGLDMDNRTASFLIEMAGEDSGILCGELDKFASYLSDPKSPGKQITPELIEKLTGHIRTHTVFDVINAMIAGQAAKALEQLDGMMRLDREAEFSAVGAFAWHVRRLYKARILLDQRTSEFELIKQVGVWHNKEGFMRQVRALKITDIARALRTLAEIDFKQKTGAGTVKDGLETFIVAFSRSSVR